MAKGRVTVGGINWVARLDIREAKKSAAELKEIYKKLATEAAKGLGNIKPDTKPLTGYQQAMISLRKALIDSQVETERLRQETQLYRTELEKNKAAQQANNAELSKLKVTEQDLNNQLKQGALAQQALRTEIDKNKLAQQQLNAELAKGKIEQQGLRTEIARMNLARKQEVEAARAARKAAQEVSGSYNEAQRKLKDLGTEIKGAEGGFRKLTPELKAKIKEYNELNEALKKFDASMGNHQRNVGNYRNALRGAAEDLLSFASGYLSIGNALTYTFNQTLAFQRIKTPLTFIIGSEGEANNKLAELKKFSNDLGVEYFGIANSYKQFTAAARASNFDLGKSETIFKSVAKAGAVLGLSNDTLQGTFLALQQMISKGTVQSEELRGQLSERLPGAFALAAKAMGVTEKALGEMLKKGEVTANDMLPKLAIELDKAYGDKATGGIQGLNAELGQLKTAIESLAGEGSRLDKYLFQPIVRGARLATNELAQMFRGSFTENIGYLFTFSNRSLENKRNAYDLRDAKANNLNAQSEAEKYSTEGKSLAELRTKYQQLGESVRNAIDAQKKFKSGVASGDLKETNDASVVLFTSIANGIIAQRKRIGQAYAELKKNQKDVIKEVSDDALTAISEIRKRIAELSKLPGSAIEGSEISNRIKALQARLRKPKAEAADTEGEAALKAQQTLQLRMDELAKTARRKTLSDSEAEIQAVKDKYAKLFEEAKIFNDAVDRFNNNPKNANKTKRLRVDTGGIVRAQAYETDAVNDKVAADKLKNSLEDQKKIYEDYEQYRITFGEEKAKERFKNAKDRYGDLIDLDKTYLEKLNEIQSKLQGDDKAKGGDAGGGEFVARQMKVITESTEAAKVEEKRKYDEFLKEFQSYANSRKVLQEQMTAEINKAVAKGDMVEAENARISFQKKIKDLGENHVQQLQSYQRFFEDVEDLTAEELGKRLEVLKKDLSAIESPELKVFIEKLLKSGKATLSEKTISGYQSIASALQEASQSSQGLNEGLSEGLNTAAGLAGALVNIKQSFDSFQKAKKDGDTLGMIGSAISGVSAIMGIASFVTSIFQKARQFREESKKVIDEFNKQRFFSEFDINQLYRERLRTQLEINAATIAGLKSNTDELKKQLKENADDYARIAGLLSGESYITGYKNQSSAKLEVKQVPILESLSSKSYQDIEKLFISGQLTDKAKSLFEQLRKLKDEGVDIDKLIADNSKAIMNRATGTTADSIRDSIVTGFENGYRKAEDFANDFKGLMSQATKEIFKEFIDNQALKEFYEKYANMAKEGPLTPAQKATLKDVYDGMIGKIQNKYDELKSITGDDFLAKPQSNSTSVSGTITSAGMTEDTANKAMGVWRGTFDNTKLTARNTLSIDANTLKMANSFSAFHISATGHLSDIVAHTKRTADNTDNLEAILKRIDANTKGSSNYQALLNGGVK